MKLSELATTYEFKLDDVDTIILEQDGHAGRQRITPSVHLKWHDPQHTFDETKYPYITVILKNGETLDCKIGCYSWVTSCPKATGGVPS